MTQSAPADLGDAHRLDGDAAADVLEVRSEHGLSDAQVATRTADFGCNELAEPARPPSPDTRAPIQLSPSQPRRTHHEMPH